VTHRHAINAAHYLEEAGLEKSEGAGELPKRDEPDEEAPNKPGEEAGGAKLKPVEAAGAARQCVVFACICAQLNCCICVHCVNVSMYLCVCV